MTRALLLWQIADLLGQVASARTWWAVRDPDTYGGYLP